jgi:phosphatidylglycerophosphatase A
MSAPFQPPASGAPRAHFPCPTGPVRGILGGVKRFIVATLASFFYTGYFPFAPATFASLVWLLIYLFAPGGAWLVNPIVVVCTIPIAILLSHEAEKLWGTDAHRIVIDEFVGMQVTLLGMAPSLLTGIIGFVLFRIFDIAKPFPAGRAQRLPGGLGVVTDDVAAGVYARLILLAIAYIIHR